MQEKDPPGYPGDEAVTQAVDEALQKLLSEKGLSLKEAHSALYSWSSCNTRME